MAESYKILGQAVLGSKALDNQTYKDIIVYEVPENKQASISSLMVTNTTTLDKEYTVSLVPSSETDSTYVDVPYIQPSSQLGLFGYDKFSTYSSAYSTPISTSADGVNWVTKTPGIPQMIPGSPNIIYHQGIFIAYSTNYNYILKSTDGFSWSMKYVTYNIRSIVAGNGIFIATTEQNDVVFRSLNGWDWSQDWAYAPDYFMTVCYFDNKFFRLGRYQSATSFDGSTWTIINGMPMYTYTEPAVTDTMILCTDSMSGRYAYMIKYDQNQYSDWNIVEPSFYPNRLFCFGQEVLMFGYDKYNYSRVGYYTINGQDLHQIYPDYVSWTPQIYRYNEQYYIQKFDGDFNPYGPTYVANVLSQPPVRTQPNQFGVRREFLKDLAPTYATYYDHIPSSSNKNNIIYNKVIKPGATHEVYGGITLSPGDQIRVYSNSNELIANVYGVEI